MSETQVAQSEVLVRRDGALGRLTLNRPAALGALTTGMCEAMIAALLSWRDDPTLHAVLIDHAVSLGIGWPEIAAQLGVTRQAARQHYQRRHRDEVGRRDQVA